MNKGRVEAFTDAVLAIILTIMILEFKTPESFAISAILDQVPYLISYAIGYLFIGVAWYNHHYMFSKTRWISRNVYWANNFWMFATSFLPVATAWVGKGLNQQGPETFYFLVYMLWSMAYFILSLMLVKANEKGHRPEAAQSIRSMVIYRFMSNWKWVGLQIIASIVVLIYFPALQMVIVSLLIIFVGARFNKDSDQLFN
ncbi:TMEM175 family protein [Lentilactobacillus otakiensis]|uniref:Integral membrane protein n=1 Tax=Lentilactobacillus otakiensis DSM 19908 = JCM 15040 TaxID=1423780 RepID=S4NJR3_9LACO|nr:TMEM175 family protein [Lentilactobacillus otakiensis]KRL10433.1 hypothetical protein FD05_GL000560 [Lentilactobacillus otakiensis DSM 19908 = JCM 15040]MBZ3777101.1 TMEM175 family protein [Lentilactobacillus otakiensis]MDV3518125.1 TMEM175 family protein [Lentilactobacillus otakiensis]GAD16141.1 integral membrane protein [Lentilactobacillus otakiensis DSM 19908 = JCM 15040]